MCRYLTFALLATVVLASTAFSPLRLKRQQLSSSDSGFKMLSPEQNQRVTQLQQSAQNLPQFLDSLQAYALTLPPRQQSILLLLTSYVNVLRASEMPPNMGPEAQALFRQLQDAVNNPNSSVAQVFAQMGQVEASADPKVQDEMNKAFGAYLYSTN